MTWCNITGCHNDAPPKGLPPGGFLHPFYHTSSARHMEDALSHKYRAVWLAAIYYDVIPSRQKWILSPQPWCSDFPVFALSAGPRPSAGKNMIRASKFSCQASKFSFFFMFEMNVVKDEIVASKFSNLKALTHWLQGPLCAWAQPMRDDITM